jgi:hypothetical protein
MASTPSLWTTSLPMPLQCVSCWPIASLAAAIHSVAIGGTADCFSSALTRAGLAVTIARESGLPWVRFHALPGSKRMSVQTALK